MAEDTRLKTVLMFGGPGTGKGTQGEILAGIPGFFHSSTGDVFRSLDRGSEVGKIFTEYSSRGELVPDDVTIRIWLQNIQAHMALSHYKPARDLLILDGLPRTVAQAKLLEEHVDVLKIVYLMASDEQAMVDRLRKRALKSGRADDADENVIRNRWQVYAAETSPVLDYYPAEKVAEVDAIGTLGQVLCKVLGVVVPVQDANFPPFGS